jgi:hypothetical protein
LSLLAFSSIFQVGGIRLPGRLESAYNWLFSSSQTHARIWQGKLRQGKACCSSVILVSRQALFFYQAVPP